MEVKGRRGVSAALYAVGAWVSGWVGRFGLGTPTHHSKNAAQRTLCGGGVLRWCPLWAQHNTTPGAQCSTAVAAASTARWSAQDRA